MASFENDAGLSAERSATLRAITERQHMLHEVVGWMAASKPTPDLVKIVDQDEFTNDVVLALPDCWLAYDCS